MLCNSGQHYPRAVESRSAKQSMLRRSVVHQRAIGFVTLLDHSFPVLHVTSGIIIDCASEDGRHEAAKHLYTFRQSCRLQEEQLQQIRRAENACAVKSVSLSPTKYFVKKMESVFPRYPIKIQSVLRQYEIFQRLSDDRDVKARSIIASNLTLVNAHTSCDESNRFPTE